MPTFIDKDDFGHCLDVLKSGAPDYYLADLLLPDGGREAIVALHAFHVEITNITLAFGEPMAAQIRLQWWSEVVAGERAGESAGHPVARALLETIEEHRLPIAGFEAKLAAHIFDLYQDPIGTRNDFEAYCGETRSCMFQWAALILGAKADRALADASGHGGVATGLVNVLENIGQTHANGQIYVPSELLNAVAMSPEEFLGKPSQKHKRVVHGLIDLAREHENKAKQSLREVEKTARPAFKPLGLVPLYLKQAEGAGLEIFRRRSELSQLRKQWALWRF